MEIGVFGGTFNPLHLGELLVARQARIQVPLAKTIFVPNGIPPHKKVDVLDKELRYELVAAGLSTEPYFEASRLEVDRPGVTWSIDTLRQLKKLYGDGIKLNFIIGEDNVASFEEYAERKEFFRLCRLLIAPRQTPAQSNLADWQARLPEADMMLINCSASGISSTQIRGLIRRGQPYEHLVPPGVFRIIEAKGLYKTSPAGLIGAA